MSRHSPRPRPLLSTLPPDKYEKGWERACERAAKDADMDPQTYQALVEKLMPQLVEALAAGHVCTLPGLGTLSPWAVEKKKTMAGVVKFDYPRYCVIRFRPHHKANALVINQAPVRRAVNWRFLVVGAHSSDNCALREHDAMVASGEIQPNPALEGVPRTDKGHWVKAKAEGRTQPRRSKKRT